MLQNMHVHRSAWLQLLRRAPEVPPAEPVLTEVWQAALAIHLESADPAAATYTAAAAASGAASSPQASGGLSSSSSRKTTSGKQGASGAGGDTVTAALAAALATAAATPEPLPPGRRKQPRDGGGGGNGGGGSGLDVAAARSLLLRSRDTFLAATSGLRRRVQSGYQRQMANVLTALRVMHLLEDNSPGGCWVGIGERVVGWWVEGLVGTPNGVTAGGQNFGWARNSKLADGSTGGPMVEQWVGRSVRLAVCATSGGRLPWWVGGWLVAGPCTYIRATEYLTGGTTCEKPSIGTVLLTRFSLFRSL